MREILATLPVRHPLRRRGTVGDTVRDVGMDRAVQGITDAVGDTVGALGGRADSVTASVPKPLTARLAKPSARRRPR